MIKKFLTLLSGVVLLGSLVGCESEGATSSTSESLTSTTNGVVNISTETSASEPIVADIEVSSFVDMSDEAPEDFSPKSFSMSGVPEYTGKAYVVLGDNKPDFLDELDWDWTVEFEYFSPLDEYNRCGSAFANVCENLMPTEERGEIGQVKPSGWHSVKYDCVDGKYLYNRCHLLGYQLTGENANEENLITGTRYLNVDGMLPFEDMVADYVKESGNHVLYRVTPEYLDDELVARGVRLEAYSVEDEGTELCFDVFCYNIQPEITIDYATGESHLSSEDAPTDATEANVPEITEQETASDGEISEMSYILNTNTEKFHYPDCGSADKIKDENREEFFGTREELLSKGYSPCGNCDP